MSEASLKSYIGGDWVLPQSSAKTLDAINPGTERLATLVALVEKLIAVFLEVSLIHGFEPA